MTSAVTSSKVHKIKVFTTQISGEPSLMTVAKYEDNQVVTLVRSNKYSFFLV
jgi:hypothetical protein